MGNALPSLVFADPVAVEVSLCRIVGFSDTWQPASNMGSTSAVSRFPIAALVRLELEKQ